MNAPGSFTAQGQAMMSCARLLLRAPIPYRAPFRRALRAPTHQCRVVHSSPSPVSRAKLRQGVGLPTAERFLRELNDEQRQALEPHHGLLRLLAGPGSGKTRVIIAKIAQLIREGVQPSQIMVVTFTNKAAAELKERLRGIMPGSMASQITAGTFHGVCLRLLKRYPAGPEGTALPTVYDEDDALDTIKIVLTGSKFKYLPKEAQYRAQEVQAQMSRLCSVVPGAALMSGKQLVAAGVRHGLLQEGVPSEPALYRRQLEELGRAIDAYWAQLELEKAMDFDMILLRTLDLLQQRPDVLEQLHASYRHILIDEFQDTNQLQYELVQRLWGRGWRGVVVGDPNQAIYSWRGACPEIMDRHLEADFGAALQTHSLRSNYRSHPDIVRLAELVLASDATRGGPPAGITPVRQPAHDAGPAVFAVTAARLEDEARYVADAIRRDHARGVPYERHLVLYRTHARSKQLEAELAARGIPYVVLSGTGLWRLHEIRTALAYLRLARRPDDPALRHVLKRVSAGIGDKTIAKMDAFAASLGTTLAAVVLVGCHEVALPRDRLLALLPRLVTEGVGAVKGLAPPLRDDLKQAAKLTKKAQAGLQELRDLVALLYSVARRCSPGEVVRALRDCFYDAYIREGGEEDGKKAGKRAGSGGAGRRLQNLNLLEERGRRPVQVVSDMAAAGSMQAGDVAGAVEGWWGMEALDAFLDACSLESSADAAKAEGRVRLMTIHGAKGLEEDSVFILGVEDGNLPLLRKDDGGPLVARGGVHEELHLAYVAVTRARHRVHLTYVRHSSEWGKPSEVSRFFRALWQLRLPWVQHVRAGGSGEYQ